MHFISKLEHQINEEIRDSEIRLISDAGEQMGIFSAKEAQEIAYAKDLDLVKIAPGAAPPVCRIMDYGKFKFETEKKEKEARKNQHIVETKEIRMSPNIDTHDFEVKLANAIRFLKSGNKVKVAVRFRGREMQHTELGIVLLKRFIEGAAEFSNCDKPPKLEGRHMITFLSPNATA